MATCQFASISSEQVEENWWWEDLVWFSWDGAAWRPLACATPTSVGVLQRLQWFVGLRR